MGYQFILVYPVPDSDRYAIRDKQRKVKLFQSIEEAISFRQQNELSDVHDEATYWITPDKYFHPEKLQEPNLENCYIELWEEQYKLIEDSDFSC